MLVPDPQFARSDVLRVFNQSQVYLFVGAAIGTVGLLASFLCLVRRRFDPLLLWFSLLAVLYGIRLGLQYQLLWGLGLRPVALQRSMNALGFLLPIPAFFFFRTLNIFGRPGRILSKIVWPLGLLLAVGTLVFGNREISQEVSNIFILAALLAVILLLFRAPAHSRDVTLMRLGLLIQIAGALYDNITGLIGRSADIEPFTFVVLLALLGIVAGRRTLGYEQQWIALHKELDIAQQIQLSILPGPFFVSGNFRVAARYVPMTAVAGDFYDFLLASDREAGLLIADVSGHGVPAALIASMVKLAANSQRAHADNPSDLLLGMNKALIGNTQQLFVTAGYLYLNASRQELRYSAAAHPPLILLRNGEVMEFSDNGLMLAVFAHATYPMLTYPIKSGDRLVLYTDGLLEATNTHQEEFGPDRLHALIRETGTQPHTEAADHIISAIQQWSAVQSDDLTILLCDYTA